MYRSGCNIYRNLSFWITYPRQHMVRLWCTQRFCVPAIDTNHDRFITRFRDSNDDALELYGSELFESVKDNNSGRPCRANWTVVRRMCAL